MPYIKEKERHEIDTGREPETPGELNYKIMTIVRDYLLGACGVRSGQIEHGFRFDQISGSISYHYYNEAMGVLECVKQELYRRLIAPHEDEKRKENGDVF